MPEYELNLTDFLRIFHKRKHIMLITFAVMLIVSLFYLSKQPEIYEASTTVKVLERESVAGILTEWIVYTPADIMESQAKIITGFPIMKKVALRLGLIDKTSAIPQVHAVVGGLQARVNTATIERTNIIRISATSSDPKDVMDLANTTAEVYVEENLLEKRKQASTARQFIEEQLLRLEATLKDGERRLRVISEEKGDIKLAEPIQNRLIELEFELASLLQQYTDKHPQIVATRGQIKDLKAQLRGFSGEDLEYAGLAREVEVNKKLYSMLKEKLEEARITEAHKVGDVSIVDPARMPGFPISPNKRMIILFGAMLGLLMGTVMVFIVDSLDTSIGTIEDMESITKLPVLGVVPSVLLQSEKEKTVYTRIYNRLFAFRHKQTKQEENYIRLAVYYEPTSSVTEAYRTIRTNLKLNPALKTILISSAGPREGKTTVVTNLGLVIAQAGEKTLLVSSDLRRPAIAKTFGVNRNPGFNEVVTKVRTLDEGLRNISDIILGDMQLEKIMKVPGMENLSLLPTGHTPHNPAELLESKETQNLIDELKRRFDVIIFDSPPVLPITDACLLSPKVDGVILVYEAGRTAKSALLRAKAQLESAGAKILGLVLNHTKHEVEAAASYPYYYRYKYYYGEGEPGRRKRKTSDEEGTQEA
jgi:tyrosine-protein kinase Etk/Wzc